MLAQLYAYEGVIYMWISKNGGYCAPSCLVNTLQNANEFRSIVLPCIVDAKAGDFFEVMFSSTNIYSGLVSSKALEPLPFYPSITLNINKISDYLSKYKKY
jgi:hypothetical protein